MAFFGSNLNLPPPPPPGLRTSWKDVFENTCYRLENEARKMVDGGRLSMFCRPCMRGFNFFRKIWGRWARVTRWRSWKIVKSDGRWSVHEALPILSATVVCANSSPVARGLSSRPATRISRNAESHYANFEGASVCTCGAFAVPFCDQ